MAGPATASATVRVILEKPLVNLRQTAGNKQIAVVIPHTPCTLTSLARALDEHVVTIAAD